MDSLFAMNIMASGRWDFGTFLNNSTVTARAWGGYFVILIGTLGIIWSAYRIFKKLHSDNDQTSWVKLIIGFVVSGAFAAGGWNFVRDMSYGGKETFEKLGGGDDYNPEQRFNDTALPFTLTNVDGLFD